jgi:PleD family two-component response regulator
VVLSGANRLDAERVSQRLQAALAVKRSTGQEVEASFGIAVHEPGQTPEELMGRADQLLYRAKRRRSVA